MVTIASHLLIVQWLWSLSVWAKEDYIIEPEFARVTYSSAVKLAHIPSDARLHSHKIAYGSGSGQQSVTGLNAINDPNSYWVVMTGLGESIKKRGDPVECGSVIRLQHLGYTLSRHYFGKAWGHGVDQEVSGYAPSDYGDNWTVLCEESGATHWKRETPSVEHFQTGYYLSSNAKHRFQHPIPGQLEISAAKKKGTTEKWAVMEGIFFSSPDTESE